VELHSQAGRYYRLRIPVFGRALAYQPDSADLYLAGGGGSMYRLNLEQGRFLNSLDTMAPSINCLATSPEHGLVCGGTTDGRVTCWDPRTRSLAGALDVALAAVTEDTAAGTVPAVTAITHRSGLSMAVGTSTGQVLLYDLRSSKPLLVKDHMYGLPIKKVVFAGGGEEEARVLSVDSQVVRIWARETGKAYTSIEATADFNDLEMCPRSGLMFLANEQPRMQVFYVPSLGPAPRWAAFLDSLTEELEESSTATVYDDYKFVTKDELLELGLEHLLGSPLLRAHLHGFFIDIRLFRKAASARPANPLESARRDLVARQIEEQRKGRVRIEAKLPKVNKDLFMKLTVDGEKVSDKKKAAKGELLADARFGALFEDSRFEVDTTEEAFRLINPVVSKMDKDKRAEFDRKFGVKEQEEGMEHGSDDDVMKESEEEEEESSDDEERQELAKELKKVHKNIAAEKVEERKLNKIKKQDEKLKNISKLAEKAKLHVLEEVKSGSEFQNVSEKKSKKKSKKSKQSLEERLEEAGEGEGRMRRTEGGHTMTFQQERSRQAVREEEREKEHRAERLAVRRSAKSLKKDRVAPKFWLGKRVK